MVSNMATILLAGGLSMKVTPFDYTIKDNTLLDGGVSVSACGYTMPNGSVIAKPTDIVEGKIIYNN
jgi:hypothetical protein